jgi:Beta/Gamma crystallin
MTKKQSIPNSNPQRKRIPKLISGMLFLVVTLISFAAFVHAHDPQYDDQNYSFRAGYSAGYGHGDADQRARTDFDFRHDSQSQNNNNSRQDLNFRLGYVEGYADGFFRRNPLFAFQQQGGSHGQYNQGQYNDSQYNQTYGSPNQSTITVFTGTGYQGYARQFRTGQYPSIEGRLDDDIQSVRVNSGLRVVLFEHDKFKGRSIVIERDTWDLGNFRKKAGSMIIEQIRYGQLR